MVTTFKDSVAQCVEQLKKTLNAQNIRRILWWLQEKLIFNIRNQEGFGDETVNSAMKVSGQ